MFAHLADREEIVASTQTQTKVFMDLVPVGNVELRNTARWAVRFQNTFFFTLHILGIVGMVENSHIMSKRSIAFSHSR